MDKRLSAIAVLALAAGTLYGCIVDEPYEHGARYESRDRGYYEHDRRYDRRDDARGERQERREERHEERY